MIVETIITSVSKSGSLNIAPFGIKRNPKFIYISPYIPSKTLQNLRETNVAVINYLDNSEVFVNCIIGENNILKKKKCRKINCFFIQESMSYEEVEVVSVKEDDIRPVFRCKIVNSEINKPYKGLNRANNAIIEACILASRIKILKSEKIINELKYLSIAVEKTAGKKEMKSWKKINKFIMERI